MKKTIILFISILFAGCETKNTTVINTDYKINGRQLELIIIDSCEYIGNVNNTQSDFLTHKGNCTFCKKRAL